jgi:hypothetical protein
MNHRPTCPECKSESLEPAGAPIQAGGKTWFPRRCTKCGHFWSAEEPLTLPAPLPKLTAPAPAAEIQGVPPAAPAAPAAEQPTAPAAPAAQPAPAAAVPAKRRGFFGGKAKP